MKFTLESKKAYNVDIKIKKLSELSKLACFIWGGIVASDLTSLFLGTFNRTSFIMTSMLLLAEFVKIKIEKKED